MYNADADIFMGVGGWSQVEVGLYWMNTDGNSSVCNTVGWRLPEGGAPSTHDKEACDDEDDAWLGPRILRFCAARDRRADARDRFKVPIKFYLAVHTLGVLELATVALHRVHCALLTVEDFMPTPTSNPPALYRWDADPFDEGSRGPPGALVRQRVYVKEKTMQVYDGPGGRIWNDETAERHHGLQCTQGWLRREDILLDYLAKEHSGVTLGMLVQLCGLNTQVLKLLHGQVADTDPRRSTGLRPLRRWLYPLSCAVNAFHQAGGVRASTPIIPMQLNTTD